MNNLLGHSDIQTTVRLYAHCSSSSSPPQSWQIRESWVASLCPDVLLSSCIVCLPLLRALLSGRTLIGRRHVLSWRKLTADPVGHQPLGGAGDRGRLLHPWGGRHHSSTTRSMTASTNTVISLTSHINHQRPQDRFYYIKLFTDCLFVEL